MKAEHIKVFYLIGASFILGVMVERAGYVPMSSEQLLMGISMVLTVTGVLVVGWVLLGIWKDRRDNAKIEKMKRQGSQ